MLLASVHPFAELDQLLAAEESIYGPRRMHFGGATNWLDENLNVVLQYGDWLAAGGASSVDEIGRGQGKVVRHGLLFVRAFRGVSASGCLGPLECTRTQLGLPSPWLALRSS